MVQLDLRHPPFWISTLESKKAILIFYCKENIEDHYLRKFHHICLRNRHQLNQMSHVSYASEHMALQLVTHSSVRKALTLQKVLLMYLLRSKSSIQAS